MSASKARKFDLIKFAKEALASDKKIPSFDSLMGEPFQSFEAFLANIRKNLKGIRESGKTVLVVLGTGGTFQSAETDHGLAPTGSLEESFKSLGLPEDPSVHIELCDLMNLDSSQMNVDHWRFLAEMILKIETTASDLYDSIIVTHGTDTMAKGSAYLSFMLKGFPKSIIFTGSQQPARTSDTDAKDQMERTITAAKISANANRRITEVMVCCGLKVTRGTWAIKQGDKTSNAFGPWNQPHQDFDARDWEKAARESALHRLAPALLDFGTGKSRDMLEFAGHAIDFDRKGPLSAFTEITAAANIFPASLTDKSSEAFAQFIKNQRVSILTQLGSATADNRLVSIALEAAKRGKIIIFQSPFSDSTTQIGTYAAGSEAKVVLSNVQRSVPIINTSPATFDAKTNFLLHKLGIHPASNDPGLGLCYSSEDLRMFYDNMEQNLVGELV